MTDHTAREGILNYLTGRALCSVPRSVEEAEGLLDAFLAESAVSAGPAPATDRADLRDRIARAARTVQIRIGPITLGLVQRGEPIILSGSEADAVADVVLAVLPASTGRADELEAPLSPYYEHPECGFHWHGRDGMDIPLRDGQPVCPRCTLAKAEKKLAALQKRRDEVGAECKRRGKRVLEQSEQILALERQLDEVRRQLGAEILRAGQAESGLERIRVTVRRLAAHAVGFQDVLDESDRGPWDKTVSKDIAELIEELSGQAAAEAQEPPADRAAVLSEAERTMLTYALDQAQERIWSEDGFTDEDQAAVTSLRRMANETPQPETRRCTCPHPADEHSVYGCVDGCACEWMPKRPPMDPVHILGIKADDGPPPAPAAVAQPDEEA